MRACVEGSNLLKGSAAQAQGPIGPLWLLVMRGWDFSGNRAWGGLRGLFSFGAVDEEIGDGKPLCLENVHVEGWTLVRGVWSCK